MLHDLIPFYPKLEANDSQLVLYSLAEFKKLEASKATEKRVKPGEYYKHQLIRSRLMFLKDRQFLIDEPGTGKSCTITLSNEAFKDSTNIFKKYYMVVYSSLIDAMKYQIICKCTDNKYINDEGGGKSTKSQVRNSGRESFKSNYELLSYNDMYKKILGKTAAEIQEEFNYSIFNFDEITGVVTLGFSTTIKKENTNGSITWIERPASFLTMLYSIKDMDDERIINYPNSYVQLWRMFHCVQNSKITIASGTPIMNRTIEFLILCNLLLPLDKQFNLEEFGKNIFYYNLKKYTPYLNGIITYIKASNVVAKANYMGKVLQHKYLVEYPLDDTSDNPQIGIKKYDSRSILYRVEMFGYQANKIYKNKTEIYSEQIASETNQYICYVDFKDKTSIEANNDQKTLELLTQPGINGLNVRMNSCAIFSEIFRIEKRALEESRRNGKPGPRVCFNYMNLTESGIGSLKKLFASSGIFEVIEDFTFLKTIGGDYCNIGGLSFRNITKKPRAVFLTGFDSNPEQRDKILQLAGSPDNIHGEYIQFIDGSSVMGIGVNVKSSSRFMRVLPEWNDAKDKQSRDRVFREDAHDEIRKEMADDIAVRTGERPNPYDLDVYIDVYNFCGFCRYFYINTKFVSKFLPDMKLSPKCPFNIDTDITSGRKTITTEKIFNGKTSMLIGNTSNGDNMNVVHLVGFCESGTGKSIHHKQILDYCTTGEIPYVEISKKTDIEISADLYNLTVDHFDIILCIAGIIYVSPFNSQIKEYISNKILLYHTNCEFMNLYSNGTYEEECYAIVMKDNKKDKTLIPEGAVLNEDYELIEVDMLYISPSERQYIQMEEKSFGSRRLLRIAKRTAIDCVVDYERIYNVNDVNGSLECDYEDCKYTCSSTVLTDKSDESFLYENGKTNWTNYEVLYSDSIIKECKENIIKMFNNQTKIEISEIFNKLLPKCGREYFVNMAIYDLIVNKIKIKDSFGFNSYISNSEYELFLTRDFPKLISNGPDNTGEYIKKLIAVENQPDYRTFHSIDDDIIDQIEKISFNPSTPDYENLMIKSIIEKISLLKMYPSNIILIEKCFGRIAYNRTVSDQFRNPEFKELPVDEYITGYIYPIRCFSTQNPDGSKIFFHNHPEINVISKQGEISKLIKGTNPIRVFYVKQGKPAWRDATKEESVKLKEKVILEIAERLDTLITKTITVPLQNGTSITNNYKSSYYISYNKGIYRLAAVTKGTGENLETVTDNSIITCLNWFKTSAFLYIPGNYQAIERLEHVIANPEKKSKKSGMGRNDLLINFFRDNGLIFTVGIEDLSYTSK